MLAQFIKNIFSQIAQKEEGQVMCPDLETLAAYIDKNLALAEQEKMDKHLVACEACLSRVIVCSAVRQEDIEQKKTSAIDVVIRFFKDSAEMLSRLAEVTTTPVVAVGAVRGAGEKDPSVVRFTRRFEQARTEFEVTRLEEDDCAIKVRILHNDQLYNDVRVSLITDDHELESHLTENGETHFEPCGFDTYTVNMKKGPLFIGEILIQIQHGF